ncbi:MAG TPA: flagellar basal body P-ring formation chaperone FlgA [Hyphomicrobiales bacterium]|nr:flagellar basal body P-ring formation chaperone FlgA [Hyphomicrobiales bacterium]
MSGPVVRLGDLVEGAGSLGEVPLFRSPDLGYTGPVTAADVVAAGEAAGLAEIDTAGLAVIEVTRASRLLAADDLVPLVQGRLATAAGLSDPSALQVNFDADSARVALPLQADGQPSVVDAAWSPVDGHFQAVLIVRRRDGGAERRTLTGTAVETAAVVVAARDLSPGTVVGTKDVEVVRRPRAGLARQSLSAVASAVGLEARRAIRAGETIRAGDLGEPELVKRGDVVTVVLAAPGMTLTVRGQAMRDGRRGDLVTVQNLLSKRILQGTVTGTAEVTLIASAPRLVATALR